MMLLQKWHPDKHKGDSAITAKFQEINEAYNGISSARMEHDLFILFAIWFSYGLLFIIILFCSVNQPW